MNTRAMTPAAATASIAHSPGYRQLELSGDEVSCCSQARMRPNELLTRETGSEAFLERYLPGTSPAVVRLRQRVIQLNTPAKASLVNVILVLGEPGSGKNHLARVLAGHRRWLGVRNDRNAPSLDAGLEAFTDRFREIHLPAVPDTLIESELFGYTRGAFTGARGTGHTGLLGDAKVNDLLLDEIGDASPALQAKLLQVVETGKFRPVGSPDLQTTDARLLMATNRDLAERVRTGAFREDMHWRLREFVVYVPPLREQRENIIPIARKLEADARAELPAEVYPDAAPPGLSEADLEWATHKHDWPGNVRELEHAIRLWLFEDGKVSLEEIVRQVERESGTSHMHADASTLLRRLVGARIEAARRDATPIESLDDLIKEFSSEAKGAVVDWYDAEKPAEGLLKRLFNTRPDSIRNKISKWRRER